MRRLWIFIALSLLVAASAYGGYSWHRLLQRWRTPPPAPEHMAPHTADGTWLAQRATPAPAPAAAPAATPAAPRAA